MWKFFAGLAVGLVGVVVVLYFSNDYFRAWVQEPKFMYECSIEKELPDAICIAGTDVKQTTKKAKKKINELFGPQ